MSKLAINHSESIRINSKLPVGFRGFTFVELMIAVTVLGILATIAIPHYRNYIVHACRTDAMISLEKVANEQSQYYFDFNSYANSISLLPVDSTSFEEHYTLTTGRIGGNSHTFIATAKPSESGDCLPDNDIEYRVSHNGLRERKENSGIWIPNWE